MNNWLKCGAFALTLVVPAGASADEPYVLKKQGDGFVRLDKETGETSYCEMEREELVCRLSVDERDAYERQIARLVLENERLKDRLAADGGSAIEGLPTDEDIDQVASLFERFAKAMLDSFKDLEKELEEFGKEPADPT